MNIIWGRFDEVTPPVYEYAYFHEHTCYLNMVIQCTYKRYISDVKYPYGSRAFTKLESNCKVNVMPYVLLTL